MIRIKYLWKSSVAGNPRAYFRRNRAFIETKGTKESARVIDAKIKFTHLDNAVIADEFPDAIEDEGEAHAKHN